MAMPDWQQELASAVRDPVELLAMLGLDPVQVEPDATAASLRAAAQDFPLRVPHSYIARMRPGDPHDPLLRQVLATGAELAPMLGYTQDPLQEQAARGPVGLLQKYAGRALLITTGACAVHCRYCFRRHFDYGAEAGNAGEPRWAAALAHVAADSTLREIILSGGDPLSLGNARLATLLQQLAAVGHVERIRIHTRTAVVLPARVDDGLLALLERHHDLLTLVIHANHPAELDTTTGKALRALAGTCTALLNQSVLLRGINDCSQVQRALAERLFACGVLPYYLHQLDQVAGAAHFAVGDLQALALHRDLQATLPGYLVPRLVRENAGASGKTPIVSGQD